MFIFGPLLCAHQFTSALITLHTPPHVSYQHTVTELEMSREFLKRVRYKNDLKEVSRDEQRDTYKAVWAIFVKWINNLLKRLEKKEDLFMDVFFTTFYLNLGLFVTQSHCLASEDLEYRAKIIWTI